MKRLSLVISLVAASFVTLPVQAKKSSGLTSTGGGSHSVRGHVRKDGTYVQPHHATNRNSTQRDNWSSKPNVNPYTGKPGTNEPTK
jgi:hypothetical protein